jgi:hypothetical protein
MNPVMPTKVGIHDYRLPAKGLFGNTRSNSDPTPDIIMAAQAATHDFVEIDTARRGWRAFARHDVENSLPRSSRFGYSLTSPNLTQSHSGWGRDEVARASWGVALHIRA